jgi:hypothetical protein
VVLRCDIDGDGRIKLLHSVVAREKLSAIRFPASAARLGPTSLTR